VTEKVEVARVSTPNDESRHITGVQVRNAASTHAAPPPCELIGTASPPTASEPHERGADAATPCAADAPTTNTPASTPIVNTHMPRTPTQATPGRETSDRIPARSPNRRTRGATGHESEINSRLRASEGGSLTHLTGP
jgi:hypothetical protein